MLDSHRKELGLGPVVDAKAGAAGGECGYKNVWMVGGELSLFFLSPNPGWRLGLERRTGRGEEVDKLLTRLSFSLRSSINRQPCFRSVSLREHLMTYLELISSFFHPSFLPDIQGANINGLSSLLVSTGVYRPSSGVPPAHTPTRIVTDVEEGVEWVLRKEGVVA